MSNTNTGRIFNVDEPKGADAARFETTAANAQVEAPNASSSRMVERNAEAAGFAAKQAAEAAKARRKESTGTDTGIPATTAPLESGHHTIRGWPRWYFF
ncbi:hypothetical protein D9758_002277 [Tetrapyrgos nigripes]|uniref:SMP domain-containing protein n=1 Tax=Tetrapyrgos nigripes TaxID=182062 RepID=A0A8H5LSJ9_9AGAR|nr:hypothetical protein D9758_002277 [Tetrapyrgos nigripes]